MACVTNAIYCILLFIFFHILTFEMHPGTVHRVCLAAVVCTDECPLGADMKHMGSISKAMAEMIHWKLLTYSMNMTHQSQECSTD